MIQFGMHNLVRKPFLNQTLAVFHSYPIIENGDFNRAWDKIETPTLSKPFNSEFSILITQSTIQNNLTY